MQTLNSKLQSIQPAGSFNRSQISTTKKAPCQPFHGHATCLALNNSSDVPVDDVERAQNASTGAQSTEITSSRRMTLGAALLSSLAVAATSSPAEAVMGSIAGRIPGISGPDKDGFYTYTRPEGKSGGHGIGWSEIPQYSFKVPQGWDEVPVSIADLGGTEIDLRYGREDSGNLQVVVAPVLRFLDVGFGASVTMEELGEPQKIIEGFAPELFGKPLIEGDVLRTEVEKKGGLTYYMYEVKPHHLVIITATGPPARVFILATTSNSLQWRKSADELRVIQKSFLVPKAAA